MSDEFPVFWQRARGANVWDVDGNRYLDVTSGFGVATAGYLPLWSRKAIAKQSAMLIHGMGDVHPTKAKAELCRLLSSTTFERWGAGKGKTILGSAGAEAVEAALKTAHLATGRTHVLAFENSYHGLTMGALTTTGRQDFRSPFQKQLGDWVSFVPFPHAGDRGKSELSRLEKAIRLAIRAKGRPAAILAEPVQGRAGEVFPPMGFLRMLKEVCQREGALLILDEIYTGFFRTGPMFACEVEGVVPDLICLGKALTGGYPVSACIGQAEVMDVWPVSTGEALHTSTFLGNPLGCALACASLRQWQAKQWPERIQKSQSYWEQNLKPMESLPYVREVRGRGLLWGLELDEPRRAGCAMLRALRDGVILLSGGVKGNVVTFSPPAVLTQKEVRWVCGRMESWLRD